MTLTLGGCATSADRKLTVQGLPPLPGDLAVVPRDPGVAAGEDARLALARTRKGLAQCRAQYVDLKNHYNRLAGRD